MRQHGVAPLVPLTSVASPPRLHPFAVLHVAEAAQALGRNVDYEVPFLKKASRWCSSSACRVGQQGQQGQQVQSAHGRGGMCTGATVAPVPEEVGLEPT